MKSVYSKRWDDKHGFTQKEAEEKKRKVDAEKAKTVFARFPENDGIGLAVFNRLVRAAAFNIIEV